RGGAMTDHERQPADPDAEVWGLADLLAQIREQATEHDRVTLGAVMEAVGGRSFGPLLLIAGLVTLAPVIGDIPGVPTMMALLVLSIVAQLLFHSEHLWLPR